MEEQDDTKPFVESYAELSELFVRFIRSSLPLIPSSHYPTAAEVCVCCVCASVY